MAVMARTVMQVVILEFHYICFIVFHYISKIETWNEGVCLKLLFHRSNKGSN